MITGCPKNIVTKIMKHLRKNPTLNLKLILDIQDMPIFETTMQNTRHNLHIAVCL